MHFKQACRNNKVIVGNEAWATSLECIRIDVYRSLTPYLAGFCTTHRDLFCMHSAVVYVSVLFGNDLYGLLNVWLPATGKYSCYGKVICGFMNACVPNSPSKTKRLRKLCQRMPCWLQVKHDSFKASRKNMLQSSRSQWTSLFTRQHGFRGVNFWVWLLISLQACLQVYIYIKVTTNYNCKHLYS